MAHYHEPVNTPYDRQPLPARRRSAGMRPRAVGHAIAGLALLAGLGPALAQVPALAEAVAQAAATADTAPAPRTPPSAMDALMFYQLLIAELELQNGRPLVAVDVLLDAARRTRDEQLYQRAVDVAVQSRAGDRALAATAQWRSAMPESTLALRYQVQLLGALDRPAEALEPVRTWLARSTPQERLGVLAGLPRIFVRGPAARSGAEMIEQAVQPYTSGGSQRDAALVMVGRAWMLAGDDNRALQRATQAAQVDPTAISPALLALELMPRLPAAESLVTTRLARGDVEPPVRLAYVRVLTRQQRLGDAAVQLQAVVRQQPAEPGPYLTLGAVELELRHPREAEIALQRYIELTLARNADPADEETRDSVTQARLMLAQAAEMQRDWARAEQQLALVKDPERAQDVQSRRASMLVRQGRWREARDIVRAWPETTPAQQRQKLFGEVQLLREAQQWGEAYTVLAGATERFPNEIDLLYEQAMVAEKLNRLDDMERLLRRVIALKPDHQHAYNALGYSLADRGLRLDEARTLVEKALSLAPGDPFITDSLGWVEFRAGRHQEALRWLRQAYQARPDTEIAAHLGEVLWVTGQQDEARRVWREGRQRDADNAVLRETLQRLVPGGL
jgi:tetratricopeptide (TPR) repeat protein